MLLLCIDMVQVIGVTKKFDHILTTISFYIIEEISFPPPPTTRARTNEIFNGEWKFCFISLYCPTADKGSLFLAPLHYWHNVFNTFQTHVSVFSLTTRAFFSPRAVLTDLLMVCTLQVHLVTSPLSVISALLRFWSILAYNYCWVNL